MIRFNLTNFFRNFVVLAVSNLYSYRLSILIHSNTTGSNDCHQATGPRHQSPNLNEYQPASESNSQTAFQDLQKYVKTGPKNRNNTNLPIQPFGCAPDNCGIPTSIITGHSDHQSRCLRRNSIYYRFFNFSTVSLEFF